MHLASQDLKEYLKRGYEPPIGDLIIPKGEKAIYDTGSKNYHFYPQDANLCSALENSIATKITDIKDIAQNDVEIKAEETEKDLDNSDNNDNIIHIWFNVNGELKQNYKPICHLFKFMKAKKNGNFYELNFMRFFISRDNKVNCIAPSIQFDRIMNAKDSVNKNGICYPTTYQGQSEKTLKKLIRLNEGKPFIYNPQLKFDDKPEKILIEFKKFMEDMRANENGTVTSQDNREYQMTLGGGLRRGCAPGEHSGF